MGASVIIVVVVFLLELIAFGLGIGAEQRRAVGSLERIEGERYCVYSSDIATGLGAGAFLFLLAGQALMTASTRCLCCGGSLKPGTSRAFAIILFMLNWLCFIVAEACFLAGSVQNAKHTQYLGTRVTCETIRKSTFAAGVAFTFFNSIVSSSYYMCYHKAQEGSWPANRPTASVNMATF